MHHIRPFRLFSQLPADDRDILYHIPEMSGSESLTVFSLDTLILVAAARIFMVGTMLEIGTSHGYNAFQFARNTRAEVTTIDIASRDRYAWDGYLCSRRIHRTIGKTSDCEPSPYDMVFIDADHSYEWVKKDTEFAVKCEPKVIAWHDYTNHRDGQVTEYLDELAQTMDIYHIEDSWIALWFRDGLK